MFTIKGRGTVVTGRIQRGKIQIGEPVEIVGLREDTKTSLVTGIEIFQTILTEAVAGENVGLLLRGVNREEVERGMVIAEPGSITANKRFLCRVHVLSQEEGGREQTITSGYRPQFYFWTRDVTGTIKLTEGVEMVMPGDTVSLEVELIVAVALESDTWFAIREGGFNVGYGNVTEIIE